MIFQKTDSRKLFRFCETPNMIIESSENVWSVVENNNNPTIKIYN